MSLIELQRELLQLCCGPAPSDAQLARIGDPRIFGLYRELIRNRLRGELKIALRRTYATAGAEAFDRAFTAHMDADPPRTRYFHAVVAAFVQSAAPFFRADPALPAHLGDLCEYEGALWAVSDLPDVPPESIGEFAFDRAVVLSPALRWLALGHAVHRKPVHRKPAPGAAYERGEHYYLCVHRRPDEKRAKTWELNAITYDLMTRLAQAGTTPSAAVQQLAAARAVSVDEKFLDGLCTVLADFLERGIILGAR